MWIKKGGIYILVLLLSSCGAHMKSGYKKLSGPEKRWALLHPFKAKKAYPMAAKALKITDSLASTGIIDKDNNGGSYDAFKHSYWMAKTAKLIGMKSAIRLGKAHERGNYKTFKKRRLEDGFAPDKPSSDMDLFNNDMGAKMGNLLLAESENKLIEKIVLALNKGELVMLLKNKEGQFLDCDKNIIPADSLKNRWDNKKCVVPSFGN